MAELRVNGFPFELVGGDVVTSTTTAISPYLKSGDNLIAVSFDDERPLPVETVPFLRVVHAHPIAIAYRYVHAKR